jgi:hypothetical protein
MVNDGELELAAHEHAGAKRLGLQTASAAAASAPSPDPAHSAHPTAAALAAFVRAAAAEVPSVQWSCELHNAAAASAASDSSKVPKHLPDAYGGAAAASLAAGPLLMVAPEQHLPVAPAAASSMSGTTVISGGLGGLGSMVAAMLAVQSSAAAGAHLVLLGPSGRAPASNVGLQVKFNRLGRVHPRHLTSCSLQPQSACLCLARHQMCYGVCRLSCPRSAWRRSAAATWLWQQKRRRSRLDAAYCCLCAASSMQASVGRAVALAC